VTPYDKPGRVYAPEPQGATVAYEVVMPQMGESIAEGTITAWSKRVGERIERDEPLFEISTDKVDAEIPSPAAGVLREIKVQPGQTVAINTVVAIVEEAERQAEGVAGDGHGEPSRGIETRDLLPEAAAPERAPAVTAESSAPALEERRPKKSSPVVRRIAAEHGVDVHEIEGTGLGGRITKQDIVDYLGRPAARSPPPSPMAAPAPQPAPAAALPTAAPTRPAVAPPLSGPVELRGPIPEAYRPRLFEGDRLEEMSPMRSRIAEHMVLSRRISAHVYTVWDADMSLVAALRDKHKERWREQHGVPLTYTAFLMKATIDALKDFPVLNAAVDGTRIIYHQRINLGLAVALEQGLIVPVIAHADELNLLGLARHAADLAERARQKKLRPDEVQDGTFTITNPGLYGPLFNLPIINQPQVAILGVGAVEKRPVVIDEMLAIRPRCYLSLSFDHRVVDGAVADQFMAKLHDNLTRLDEGSL
jgi:pyruvate dehydrogenase E2 component (dihydrolipoamide acetyltransferase)